MVENVVAGQGEVGLAPTQLHHEDGEGATGAKAPQDHRPVTCALTPVSMQQGGQAGGEQLPQVQEEAQGPGAQPEDVPMAMVTVRQVTRTGGVTLLVLKPKACE